MDTELPPRTHNQPPDPLLAESNERIDTANRWLKERSDWEKWDAETADKLNAFIGQISATWDALDGRRLEEGREFKKKQALIYDGPLSLMAMAKEKLVPLRRAYLKREEDRLAEEKRKADAAAEAARKAAEDAERKAQEAASTKGGDPLRAELEAQKAREAAEQAKAAADAAPEKAAITGTYSTRAKGLQDHWSAEITNINEAFQFFNRARNPAKPLLEAAIRECILGIANKEAKRLKDESLAPPGIRFMRERR